MRNDSPISDHIAAYNARKQMWLMTFFFLIGGLVIGLAAATFFLL